MVFFYDPPTRQLEVNAIQRASAIILQKPLREGFAVAVSEALWKGKPVSKRAGGISQQIIRKESGILVHSVEGAAYWMKRLLRRPTFARNLRENGRGQ